MITRERVMELLEYNPDTGEFFWQVTRSTVRAGDEAGWVSPRGYIRISIDGKRYYAHQIAWLLHHGTIPMQLDHINRDKGDNRIENLRICDHAQNQTNNRLREHCSSRYKGVCRYKPLGKWMAYITANGKRIHLGYHVEERDAARAYNRAATKHFGEYAHLNEVTT